MYAFYNRVEIDWNRIVLVSGIDIIHKNMNKLKNVIKIVIENILNTISILVYTFDTT